MRRADVLRAFFSLVFTDKIRLPGFLCPVAGEKLEAEEDQSRDHLCKLDTHKNVDGPRWNASDCTPGNQAKVMARLLSIFEKAWQSGKVLMTAKRQMSHLSSKRGRKRIQLTKG